MVIPAKVTEAINSKTDFSWRVRLNTYITIFTALAGKIIFSYPGEPESHFFIVWSLKQRCFSWSSDMSLLTVRLLLSLPFI